MRRVQRRHGKEARLVCQTRVVGVVVPPSAEARGAKLGEVEPSVEGLAEGRPGRGGVEHRPGELVLLRDEVARLVRVGVLEPAVGVADLDAVEGLDEVFVAADGRVEGRGQGDVADGGA